MRTSTLSFLPSSHLGVLHITTDSSAATTLSITTHRPANSPAPVAAAAAYRCARCFLCCCPQPDAPRAASVAVPRHLSFTSWRTAWTRLPPSPPPSPDAIAAFSRAQQSRSALQARLHTCPRRFRPRKPLLARPSCSISIGSRPSRRQPVASGRAVRWRRPRPLCFGRCRVGRHAIQST
jgi:hypothetical protein